MFTWVLFLVSAGLRDYKSEELEGHPFCEWTSSLRLAVMMCQFKSQRSEGASSGSRPSLIISGHDESRTAA